MFNHDENRRAHDQSFNKTYQSLRVLKANRIELKAISEISSPTGDLRVPTKPITLSELR